MRELSPASDSERKKTMAKNLPPSMLPNNRGILHNQVNISNVGRGKQKRDGEAMSVNNTLCKYSQYVVDCYFYSIANIYHCSRPHPCNASSVNPDRRVLPSVSCHSLHQSAAML